MLHEKVSSALERLHNNKTSRENLVSVLSEIIDRNTNSINSANDFIDTITYNVRKNQEIKRARFENLKSALERNQPNTEGMGVIEKFEWIHVIPQELTAFAMYNRAVTVEDIEMIAELRNFSEDKVTYIKNICEEAMLFTYDKYEKDRLCEKLGL